MGYFEEAYALTMKTEGGYCNTAGDAGGETYKGVARNFHPSWSGWATIDRYKKNPNFPSILDTDLVLQNAVKQFYKSSFFDIFRGDDMPKELAIEMFDTGVNMGTGRAIKFLQVALNLLNRNQTSYQDIVADGGYGNMTHSTLMKYLQKEPVGLLVKLINIQQGNHYIEYMTKSPTQEKFARSWLSRV